MLDLIEYKELIEKELKVFFTQKKSESELDEQKELITILEDYTLRGGKRMRAYLLYLSYMGYGGKDFKQVLNASLSVELLQSFFLIHDDIIDEDEIRRGGITPHKYYEEKYKKIIKNKTKHLGNSFAILCGDLAFAYTNELMSKTNNIKSIEELNKVTAKVIFGQKRDMLTNYKDYNKEELLQNHILKTASYTFYGPLKIGMILAGKEEYITELSNNLGIAFQLQDDLLDIFGDEKTLGKPIGSDLKEGKQTIIIKETIKLAERKDKEYIQKILDKNMGTNIDIEKVKQIVISCGAKEKIENMIGEYFNKSLVELENTNLLKESKDSIKDIVVKLKSRQF
jgi:geranylgeranyl diphosphate synthase type I